MKRAPGWDESMNASYPSARLALAVRGGEWKAAAGAIHECKLYPFAYPALLGAVQVVLGVSEQVCRVVGRLLWCGGLFGLFLLAREIVRGANERGARLVPWLALALGALCPMALASVRTRSSISGGPATCRGVVRLS